MILALLLAAQAGGPSAIDPGGWLGEADYPPLARRDGAEGRAGTRLRVDAGGRVVGCEIVLSTGRADLDEATCRRVRERGRFRPARTATGKPTEGEARLTFAWRLTDGDPAPATNAKVALRVMLNADGTVRDCVQEGATRRELGFDCAAPMLPTPEQVRLLRGPADRPYAIHVYFDRRFDGHAPIVERPAGALAIIDGVARFALDAEGRPVPCTVVRDEGRVPYQPCGSPLFRFARTDAGAPTREGMVALATWFIDGGSR